jgi:hypothetical protein
VCAKGDVGKNRAEHLEQVRSYDRMRSSQPHRKAKNLANSKAWRVKFPDRARAQVSVAKAIGSGDLKKLPCMVCGLDAVAHHPDYDQPLDVVWLCQPHHKQAHAIVKLSTPQH